MTARTPTIAIVGRPNVGKSTLFNRLIGKRKSITLDEPGVTRDPIHEDVMWSGKRLRLVDTGGLGGEAVIDLATRVHDHTVASVKDADLVVVVFDARTGLTPLDRDTVELLARLGVEVLYVANKADGVREHDALVEFCTLGIDVPLGVSAEHGIGIEELRGTILARLGLGKAPAPRLGKRRGRKRGEREEGPSDLVATAGPRICRVALVGRPNVGKSSLLNAIAGRTLSLVDAQPGTTRDTVDTEIERRRRRYLLVDTAGMRRPSRIDRDVERLSAARSRQAAERADVVVLLIEPSEGMTDQDARIARLAWDDGRALVIAMNKCDLLPARASLERIRDEIRTSYPTLAVVPVAFLSVAREEGIDALFDTIDRTDAAHRREIRTVDLNRILGEATARKEPPTLGGGRVRLYYMTQTGVRPPSFAIFANRERIPADYARFLERCLRESAPFEGTPLRLRFRRRDSHGAREG